MPTVFSHLIIGLTAGAVFRKSAFVSDSDAGNSAAHEPWLEALRAGRIPPEIRFIGLSVMCAALPDVDVVGFALEIPYGHLFGHRGFFHSFFFAAMVSLVTVRLFYPLARVCSPRWGLLVAYFFVLTASHGLLDTFTSGGLGIALLAPFDHTRYLAPVAFFQAAPLDISGLLTPWGLRCIRTELYVTWIPALLILLLSSRTTSARRARSEREFSHR